LTTSPLDSAIYGDLFCDPAARRLLDDRAQIEAMLRFEGALAEAQGEVGVIPQDAAAAIARAASSLAIEPARLAAETARDGVPVPALVAALRQATGGQAASYVHWGATSQDVMDTGLVLRLRDLLDLYRERMAATASSLAALARRYRHQPMAGRTRSQQATPTTFGLKAAGWLAPMVRHRDRLAELRPRLLRLSLGGASGTLSAMGERAPAVEKALARRLDLGIAPSPWHAQRDALLELGGWLSQATASLGKMGLDLTLLAQSEVGEVRLAGGGSSTMPNKANPISAETLVSLARFNAGQIGLLHQAALQEHERGGPGWALEWLTLAPMAAATAGAFSQALSCLEGLTVRPGRMRANLDAALSLPLAEAASFALSVHLPREEAQRLVKAACVRASDEERDLFEILPELSDAPIDWKSLADPAGALGMADAFVDRVLAAWEETWKGGASDGASQ
jgi:3-carboxy-cis,cis-muconate cycloisomerase